MEPTSTPASIPNVDFTGSLFFDYNGSGLWDEGEPPISDFGVCAKHSSREWVCTETNEEGDYLFEELAPAGEEVSIKFEDSNSDEPALAFCYMNL